MKKVISIFTALSLALGVCAGLVGCKKDKGTVDTFTGVVSEETYESVEAAATAFLAGEVGGGILPTVFVGYEKTGDLSEKEISGLNLTDADRKDLESAENGIAKYKMGSEIATTAEDDEDDSADGENEETYSQRLYVLIFKGNVFRYYVPQLAVGETVTKSYYDSVMNGEKYKNCTMTYSGTTLYAAENGDRVYGGKALLSEKSVYAKTIVPYDGNKEELYYFEYEGMLYGAYRDLSSDQNTPWEVDVDNDSGSFDEVLKQILITSSDSPFAPLVGRRLDERAIIDFTFFQKTEDGMKFAIPEKYKKIGRYRGQYASYMDSVIEKVKAVTIKVKDGRLVEKAMEWNGHVGGCAGITSVTYKFDNFGTTKVEIPKEIIDLIPKEE